MDNQNTPLEKNDNIESKLENLKIIDTNTPTTPTKEKAVTKRKRIQPNTTPVINNTNTPLLSNITYDLNSSISQIFTNFFNNNNNIKTTTTPSILNVNQPLQLTTETVTNSTTNDNSKIKVEKKKERIKKEPKEKVIKEKVVKEKVVKEKKEKIVKPKKEPKERKKRESKPKKEKKQVVTNENNESLDHEEEMEKTRLKKKKRVIITKSLQFLEPFAFLVVSPPSLTSTIYLELKDFFCKKQELVQKLQQQKQQQQQQKQQVESEKPSQQTAPQLHHAYNYLEQIKSHYQEQPEIYQQFLAIMKDFKNENIDKAMLVTRVVELFGENRHLISGLKAFLPNEYNIDMNTCKDDVKSEPKKDGLQNDGDELMSISFTLPDTIYNSLEKEGINVDLLLMEINSIEQLSNNQWKLSIIDHLYSLNIEGSQFQLNGQVGNPCQQLEYNKFLKLQKELWWVKTTNKWFMTKSGNNQFKKVSHLKIWLGFLILELWYRLVWARYTQTVYTELSGKDLEILSDTLSTLGSPDLELEDHDAIELEDLGNSSLNDSDDSDDDSELDDTSSDDEEVDYQENEDEDDEDQEENLVNDPSLYNKHLDQLVHNTTVNIPKQIPPSTTTTTTTTTTSASEVDDVDMDLGNDDEEEEEEEEEQSEIIIEDEVIRDQFDLIPKVVSLFFVHGSMTDIINEIESEYWESGIWNIKKAIEVFSQFIHSYYRDNKSLPSMTFAEIHESIHKVYQKKYQKFINNLGLEFNPDDHYQWRWSPWTMSSNLEFIDRIYVQQFRNLTQNGQVSHSHSFYYLFPYFQEMKPPSHPIGDYYHSLKSRLEKQGLLNREVEKIIETLDRLLEERQLISQSSNKTIDENEPEILKAVNEYQQNRIKYLDQLIATLKTEYHKLTNRFDELPSKKKSSIRSKMVHKQQPLKSTTDTSTSMSIDTPLQDKEKDSTNKDS
ncbi:hypothetical protein DLAC_00936 [Tieghemostelium lacteum]|uniref:Histone deacetylase interacting domain-containing protein n=1 Tax=Tieghemostelium lacteum TaxID=361077 RepID=A0A152A7G0_TIELA|nr:hypothetical protein DLAC_00936 [Tieghemostelium lacteum]|eukprot:KYR02136.1 hypothetical protein DLAC_00936 [Tieghemostelium lacteum]